MKVLLLGDSIRMGYCGHVKELMQGKAEVFYPTDNGRFLQYTLRELQDWKANLRLDGNDVDVVHWNNGLWDVGHLGIGATGKRKPQFFTAARTRSRASLTDASGRPTSSKAGRPVPM